MDRTPYHYEIEIDSERKPIRSFLLWTVFISVFVAIVACAVWVFCFSKRGLNFEQPHTTPMTHLAIPSAAPQDKPFVGVSLSASALTLTEGERTMLTAVLKLAPGSPYINVESLALRWKSEHPAIVSVDRHGDLLARHPGRARISVTINDKRIDTNEAYCMVEVRPVASHETKDRSEHPITQIPEP